MEKINFKGTDGFFISNKEKIVIDIAMKHLMKTHSQLLGDALNE